MNPRLKQQHTRDWSSNHQLPGNTEAAITTTSDEDGEGSAAVYKAFEECIRSSGDGDINPDESATLKRRDGKTDTYKGRGSRSSSLNRRNVNCSRLKDSPITHDDLLSEIEASISSAPKTESLRRQQDGHQLFQQQHGHSKTKRKNLAHRKMMDATEDDADDSFDSPIELNKRSHLKSRKPRQVSGAARKNR